MREQAMNKRRFIIFDRDGTLIVKHHYLSDPEKVELIPGAASALKSLRTGGFGILVITNQSAVGRGYFDEERIAAIHNRMSDLFQREGAVIDGILFCPHIPDDRCACRKPETGLVDKASSIFGFSAPECYVIGDNACDMELGRKIGAATVLVRTGEGAALAEAGAVSCDYVVDDIYAASRLILERERNNIADA